jgi:hypothetical protein
LCLLLKASGCIAVSGGLEVASDRLLKLIDKGVTVEQGRVTEILPAVMVHAYLMYGYPTQTIQETIDSLEMVVNYLKQVFYNRVLASICHDSTQSCWFASRKFELKKHRSYGTFANNDYMTLLELITTSLVLDLKNHFIIMHGICFEYTICRIGLNLRFQNKNSI